MFEPIIGGKLTICVLLAMLALATILLPSFAVAYLAARMFLWGSVQDRLRETLRHFSLLTS